MNARDCAGAMLALCMVAGCTDSGSRWNGTMYDSAGVTIVANPDAGMWVPGEAWTLEEELRIGAVDGDPDYQFGSVAGVAVDSRGRIYVLDGQLQQIRVYSPDGRFEQAFGRSGDGPGELRAAMTLLMGPGDTLVVPDGRNLRFNRYAPDGSSLGSFRMVMEHGRPMGFRANASGVLAEQLRPLSVLIPDQPVTKDSLDAIVLRATDGTVTDTLLRFPSGRLLVPGAGTVGFQLYAAEPVWDLAADSRLVFGAATDYRLSILDEGRLQRIITMPFERRPVTDADIAAVMGEMERRWDEGGVPPDTRQRLGSRIHFADWFPPYQAVACGPDGTTWVQQVKPPSALSADELKVYHERPSPDWDVFDGEGRFLGVVTMPARFSPMVFRDDRIYGTWRDADDVGHAVRLRIARPGAGNP
jgi:hypothetical protein